MVRTFDVPALVDGISAGDRTSIARAITLVESSLPAHRHQARELLRSLPTPEVPSVRVGLSGVPGAGKSTFTDAMGCKLIEMGHKVAVLAVDPSSSRTGGSILGDRTRMARLSESDQAFIRPSPSGNHLGGVARATREAMLVVEAAGYDVVIVETVGVGQSEVAVSGMTDTFLLLALTGAGDQLQGIKRGILEIADVIAVNKADGDNLPQARVTQRELAIAMKLVKGEDQRKVPVVLNSSYTGEGLLDVWNEVLAHREYLEQTQGLEARRRQQQVEWMWSQVRNTLEAATHATPELIALGHQLEREVESGEQSALDASETLVTEVSKVLPTILG